MNGVSVQGMVLSVMPVGEYDNRLVLLTTDRGKISAFARGARKMGSPLSALCRPFATGVFTLFEGRTAYTLKEARIQNYFEALNADMKAVYYGYYFAELADYYSREGGEERMTLRLLYCALSALTKESLTPGLVRAVYELKMLMMNGDYDGIPRNMSDGAAYTLDFILNTQPEKLFTFVLSEEVLEEITGYAAFLMGKYIRRDFSALRIMEDMERFSFTEAKKSGTIE